MLCPGTQSAVLYSNAHDYHAVSHKHAPLSPVQDSWRAPRGIDGRFRRKFKGTGPHVNIGYGTDARVKHVLPNGFKKFRVFNAADVDLLLMHNRKYAVEIATKVSALNREAILERAAQLCVRVINGNSKKHEKQESE